MGGRCGLACNNMHPVLLTRLCTLVLQENHVLCSWTRKNHFSLLKCSIFVFCSLMM